MWKRANVKYRFKTAETAEEFDQIFRLNHSVFAGEVGQYPLDASERLVDKFHDKNRYVIAVGPEGVVGMLAFHDQPPCSVEAKLADRSVLDGLGQIAEIRLLAVDPAHRSGSLLRGLFMTTYPYIESHDTLVISGSVAEENMYRTMGFTPLGPAVQSGATWFIPMRVRMADLAEGARRWGRAPS
jgi:hypothetical protein